MGERNILNNIPEMNPECFLFEKYEPDITLIIPYDCKNLAKEFKKYAIGYCKAERLLVRPRTNQYAMMFEKDGREFWFHVFKSTVIDFEEG